MQGRMWSKGRIIVLCVLGGIALSGLLALIGFASARAALSAAADGDAAADGALTGSEAWTLSGFAAPSPELPEPDVMFRADPDNPIPDNGYIHALGEPLSLSGTVYANRTLGAVTVTITCAHNGEKPYPYRRSVHPAETEIYTLTDPAGEGEASLSELVDFSALSVGVHTLKLSASCEGMRAKELLRWRFLVVGPDWEQATTEQLYPEDVSVARKFFGNENFLYRYQVVNGRYILADPEWEAENIVTVTGYPNDEPWLVHKDAVPYLEKAFGFLETSFVRVHGTNGDSGLVRASHLITEYNGAYVPRFTSAQRTTLSHHSFGTAIDVNASMEVNKNTPENKALLHDDVTQHLVYNGLLKENGITYYNFTYDGAAETDANKIPETCVNYLLYELGFYRAGFDWAHYYRASSDAMHFCLSEHVSFLHDGEQGLRKVFMYAEPMQTGASASPARPQRSPKP